MKKKFIFLCLVLLLMACGTPQQSVSSEEDSTTTESENVDAPKNILFLIGDGMGVSTMAAYRHYKDDPDTEEMDLTAFDEHLIGQQMTHPGDPEKNITDSAASGTAMATGKKTYNSAIGVDNDRSELTTVLDAAKEKGKSTGIVVTSEVTHATPASFVAKEDERSSHEEIADDYVDSMIDGDPKVDVLLGGGEKYFRGHLEKLEEAGFEVVSTKEDLLDSDTSQLVGLFSEKGLPKMIDRPEETPSLEEMTSAALEKLSQNEEGFFLLVEGSQIDWAGHDNDVTGMMSEMEDFEAAFQAAIEFAEEDEETLVIATADHATGGFSMGADGEYNWYPEPIQQMQRTPAYLAQEIADGGDIEDILAEYVEWAFEADEIEAMEENPGGAQDLIEEAVDKRSFTGWTTKGHTGEDVNVYGFGPGSEMWRGLTDNTGVAEKMFELLGFEEKE